MSISFWAVSPDSEGSGYSERLRIDFKLIIRQIIDHPHLNMCESSWCDAEDPDSIDALGIIISKSYANTLTDDDRQFEDDVFMVLYGEDGCCDEMVRYAGNDSFVCAKVFNELIGRSNRVVSEYHDVDFSELFLTWGAHHA